jgi:hypothetical protein
VYNTPFFIVGMHSQLQQSKSDFSSTRCNAVGDTALTLAPKRESFDFWRNGFPALKVTAGVGVVTFMTVWPSIGSGRPQTKLLRSVRFLAS